MIEKSQVARDATDLLESIHGQDYRLTIMPPSFHEITSYYDSQTARKIRDFVDGNERVDLAIETLKRWLPNPCRSLLEVGCGIGAVSWRMAQEFPEMKVVGLDISPLSINVARSLFPAPNLTFNEQLLTPGSVGGSYDCVLLMDVYEHIAPADRQQLHASIAGVLSEYGRVVLSFPAPRKLAYQRTHEPGEIQPIDENIRGREIARFAEDIARDVLFLETVDVWNTGDYYHAALGNLPFPVPPRAAGTPKPLVERVHGKINALLKTEEAARKVRLRMVESALGELYKPKAKSAQAGG